MADDHVRIYPTVIEENESLFLPFALVGACLLMALYFWQDSTKFYGSLIASATLLIFCFVGHRKVVVHHDRRIVELFASRMWGDKLEHTLRFEDVADIAVKLHWGSGESDVDYKAYIKDRSGRSYPLMTGWKLSEGDAEAMVASLRRALERD